MPAQDSHTCTNISGQMGSSGGRCCRCSSTKETGGFMYKCTCACPLLPLANQETILCPGCWKKERSQTARQAPSRARRLQTVIKTQPLQKSLSCSEESSTHPWGSLSLCISSCSFIFPLPRLIFFFPFTEITPILIKTGRKKLHKTLGGQNNTKDKGVE